ncbi:MAG: hypothetical protein RIB45_07285 [Marivibrio sp.]|uniref:hypothetical protein n=1 Tax=Marivibrio sp. TaxID=2039719 RepID=UPI0032EE4BB8
MTSPYLDKPKRALDQALRDRGMSRADLGYDGLADARARTPSRRVRRAPGAAAIGGVLAIGLIALGVALLSEGREEAPAIAEDQIDALQDIAPAAGEPPR